MCDSTVVCCGNSGSPATVYQPDEQRADIRFFYNRFDVTASDRTRQPQPIDGRAL